MIVPHDEISKSELEPLSHPCLLPEKTETGFMCDRYSAFVLVQAKPLVWLIPDNSATTAVIFVCILLRGLLLVILNL